MKLLEHESKSLLQKSGVSIPKGELIKPKQTPKLALPLVLKSQVPIGGRGKAGGVLVTRTPEELQENITTLFKREIKSFLPSSLLAEELLAIDKEFYLSFTINRSTASIELISHAEGGVEIESHNAHDFFRRTVDTIFNNTQFEQLSDELAEYLGIENKAFLLEKLLRSAYQCFNENDCTLLEINPLILTKEGSLIAGDGKITLDDSAAFRHPEWQRFEEKRTETNFVTLHHDGVIATIANGAGLAMATVDAVADAGLKPANFLDIGGGASSKTVLAAFNRIMEFPNIKGIVINIFAGITRCDEVAKAIIEARATVSNLPPLFIRLSGTNVAQAEELLAHEHIPLLSSLQACLNAAKEEVNHE